MKGKNENATNAGGVLSESVMINECFEKMDQEFLFLNR
jgi:hypothetical protein